LHTPTEFTRRILGVEETKQFFPAISSGHTKVAWPRADGMNYTGFVQNRDDVRGFPMSARKYFSMRETNAIPLPVCAK